MDVRNIASTIRTNVSLFWRFLNEQPTDIVLGAIVGWTAFWIFFIMKRVAVVYILEDLASIVMLCKLAANFLFPPIADSFLGTAVGWFAAWSLLHIGKKPFMYPLVMVMAIVLSILMLWYLVKFIWMKIKDFIWSLLNALIKFLAKVIRFTVGLCASLMVILLAFGKTVLICLVAVLVVSLVSLVMVIVLDKIKSMVLDMMKSTILRAILDKVWYFPIFSIGVLNFSRSLVRGPILKPLLIGKSILFYLASVAAASLNMTNMNIVGPDFEGDTNLNGPPPPSPELLQQQIRYNRIPDSRQLEAHSHFDSSQGQASQVINPGMENVQMPQSQMTELNNVPSSNFFQDENLSVKQQPPTAPSTFKLVLVRTEQEQPPPPEANPAGPGHLKSSLDQIDRQVLQSVDEHAKQVSKSAHPSFRELVWDLIFSKHISNELEKVRVIFQWLATKNLKEIIFDNVKKGSPEEVLLKLKEGKTTYAKVFDTMCSYTGLHSRIIRGYAKGVNYKPGMKFNPGTNQHSWNAVYINGTWGLVDADWAARGLIKKLRKVHYRVKEYYFLPDPHHFICNHFPNDQQWQLLERPMTLEEFENMPHIKPEFFTFGLEFASHYSVIIYGRGEMNVRLKYPAHKQTVHFNFSLQFESGEKKEYKGTKLNHYAVQESVEGIASFRLRLPVKGSYILIIRAMEYTPENKVDMYSQVCKYKIVQEEVSAIEKHPFRRGVKEACGIEDRCNSAK